MMRTTLNIEEKLLDQVMKLTGETGKSKAVNKALEEYVRRMRVEHLLLLRGRLDLDLDWYEFRHMER